MFTLSEILKILKGANIIGDKFQVIKGISTDTRTIKPGDLFIPIKGPKFDGRKFIPEALRKGAVVLDAKDGLKALQTLAAYHRSKFKIPVIGVTGSVGKTTTKDMIASILSQAMPTLKNEENFNNEIGVPLTLLKLAKKHKAAVIEMAMQRLGEIEALARIVKPTIAVITNIGEAHLEFLKTQKNVAKAKAEIFKFLRRENYAVINQDDEYYEHLRSRVKGQGSRIINFGILEKANVSPKALTGIKLPLPGEHNVYNALAAIAVAKILKINRRAVKKGLESFRPSGQRMETISQPDGTKIIDDTYNANPQSMAAALKTLAGIEGRKVAVLGDMLELGKSAKSAHKKIIQLAPHLKINKIFTFGRLWPKTNMNKKLLIKKLKKFIRPRDIILVKGSRGMKMEAVVEALK